ncbi:MAG: hypothetical protein LCH38_05465 [Proteobacteria bacterium]|nr:hypothetical protein [Pseudomonadota bacterium]
MIEALTLNVSDVIESPTTHFDMPADVVNYPGFTDEEKKQVLDAWEEDARRLSVATEEGMGGGEPSRLAEVAEAKVELGIEDEPRTAPTKAG